VARCLKGCLSDPFRPLLLLAIIIIPYSFPFCQGIGKNYPAMPAIPSVRLPLLAMPEALAVQTLHGTQASL